MKNDPIIEEIHQLRDEYASEFDYNLDAMFHDLKQKERKSGWKVVARAPKPFNSESASNLTKSSSGR